MVPDVLCVHDQIAQGVKDHPAKKGVRGSETLFVVQAGGTALTIDQTAYSTAYTDNQILPLAATALGITGSIVIGRYFTNKGKARGTVTNVARRDSPDLGGQVLTWCVGTRVSWGENHLTST